MQHERDIEIQMRENHIDLMALMPCPIKVPFEKLILDYIEQERELDANKLNIVIEGHANHHLSFYDQLGDITEIEHLPDIIITPGINALFGAQFRKRFVEKNYFQAVLPKKINHAVMETGYLDPQNMYSMFAMNILVMAIYKPELPSQVVPQSFKELLTPEYKDKIILRGQKEYYCESVLLSFDHLFGQEGVQQLAKNTLRGCHPSEMTRIIRTGRTDGAAVFIMPYFYAKNLENDPAVEIVWPREGAIVNAISMLVKKDIGSQGKKLAEYIAGEKIAQMCEGAFFPASYQLQTQENDKKLLWMGWDYIYQDTMSERLDEINELFWQ